MPRHRKTKSKRKQDAIRHNVGIAAWRRAAAEYLRKGKFQHLPKKGTTEHAEMRARQQALIPILQLEIDVLVATEKKVEQARKQANTLKRKREVAYLRLVKEKEETQLQIVDTTNTNAIDNTVDKTEESDTDSEYISSDTDNEPAENVVNEEDDDDDWA